jgi:hypothetical protein
MENNYPVSTTELVNIAFTEIGKTIPIIGGILSAHSAVFTKIEANRVKLVLEEVIRRVEKLEASAKAGMTDAQAEILLYACDQARHDPLVSSKTKEYGEVIVSCMNQPRDVNEITEILDALRKLNGNNLKILYQFHICGKFFPNRSVAELVGHKVHIDPFESSKILRAKMDSLYPNFMRLQAFGLLYLSHGYSKSGELMPDIGGLSEELRKFAFLTDAGARLVRALPK